MAQKSRADLQAEIRSLKASKRVDGWVKISVTVVHWAGACFIAYFIKEAIATLAGKDTAASFSFIGNLDVSIALAWIVGAGGLAYGRYQRHLRKTTVERLHVRIRQLEEQIDPERSSSRLTPRGDTNPEDR